MLTGFENHKAFASDMALPQILQDPSLLEKEYAIETALWFFSRNKLWEICDQGVNDDTIKTLTRKINGGYTGLSHRQKETKKIYQWLI